MTYVWSRSQDPCFTSSPRAGLQKKYGQGTGFLRQGPQVFSFRVREQLGFRVFTCGSSTKATIRSRSSASSRHDGHPHTGSPIDTCRAAVARAYHTHRGWEGGAA